MITALLSFACLCAGVALGVSLRPKTKTFGLAAAESVAVRFGGLTPAQAEMAQVSAVVVGAEYTLPAEIAATRQELAANMEAGEATVEALRASIEVTEAEIAATRARDSQVAKLASAFDLKAAS